MIFICKISVGSETFAANVINKVQLMDFIGNFKLPENIFMELKRELWLNIVIDVERRGKYSINDAANSCVIVIEKMA